MAPTSSWDDGEEKQENLKKKKFFEFECSSCNANNPWPDGFKDKEEVNCHYCGTSFEIRVQDDGRIKLREI